MQRTPFRARHWLAATASLGLFMLWAPFAQAEDPLIFRGHTQALKGDAPVKLAVGESLLVNVLAKEPWNDTHLQVQAGEIYDLHTLSDQVWEDDTVGVEADGKTNWFFRTYMTPFRPLRRAKQVPFFALTGQVGKGPADQAFLIGKSLHWKVTAAGRLYCYANDVEGFYWNNTGSMAVVITRVKR